jgi:hypothetical protein
MKSLSFPILIVLAWFAYKQWHQPLAYPPGVLIAAEPLQAGLLPTDVAFDRGEFHLTPLARFMLDARVLHRKIYRYDHQAALAPVDLAVGWGPMSDQTVLDQLSISQSARFFFYEWKGVPPLAPDEIASHATNLHLIPSNDEVAAACRKLRTGELVHLSGVLVEAAGPGIGTWRSSLSRTDTGNGACELFWVEGVTQISRWAPLDR